MIRYRLIADDLHAHLFRVTLQVSQPAAQQRLSLPVWIPGSYLVREFARHLSGVSATQGGVAVPLVQVDKASWLAECRGTAALDVTYCVYAFDTSVRAAFLDAQRGFFNGTSVFLRVEGREAEPHQLELRGLPPGWEAASALPLAQPPGSVDAAGMGLYEAADYDELVDHPFELGRFWRGGFEAHGVPHEFIVAGAWPDFDGERLLADAQRVCAAEIAFWHADQRAPFSRYVFLLNAIDDGHGGLEHRASTALLASRRDLPRTGAAQPEGYTGLLGLISHEYFHAWNVKRLRPRDFERYDYTAENYTQLLWFFEGFTSYYDDLLLLRAGLIDGARYLQLLGKTIASVLATPGRQVQSVAQASFDAWVKYYRGDENTPNATISYYGKGALVALALDLTLRSLGEPPAATPSLDRVMRRLWQTSGGGPMTEADVRHALQQEAGGSLDAELDAWVHGTADLPLAPLLARFGVQWQATPPAAVSTAQRLGLRVSESALTGVRATHVLRGGAAEAAGVAAGDELLALGDWRLRRLDDAQRLLTPGQPAVLLVSRDQRLLRLALTLPSADVLPAAAADTAATGTTSSLATSAAAMTLALDPQPSAAALALREAWFSG